MSRSRYLPGLPERTPITDIFTGWISGGDEARHKYLINVIDNVLVALFAIVGDGLAPFRAVDTYHMIFIAHYARLTWRLRKEKSLPALANPNDLPLETQRTHDLEHGADPAAHDHEISVLTPKQQARLEHHQKKFARSHTFYKPHETPTHHAFSVSLLIAIVVLLDCHSLLQISLGACTWGINYKVRPATLTTVILICSISCNVTAGILISIGDRRSRKKEVVEKLVRQEMTQEAMRRVEKRKKRDLRRAERHAREEAERKARESGDRRGGEGVTEGVDTVEAEKEKGSQEVRRERTSASSSASASSVSLADGAQGIVEEVEK